MGELSPSNDCNRQPSDQQRSNAKGLSNHLNHLSDSQQRLSANQDQNNSRSSDLELFFIRQVKKMYLVSLIILVPVNQILVLLEAAIFHPSV